MATNTPNYNFILPAVNSAVDQDLWGGELNANWSSLDSLLLTASDSPTTTITGDHTVSASDNNILLACDTTSGNIIVTLPNAATAGNGFKIYIKKLVAANTVTIANATIDGNASYMIVQQYGLIGAACDGTNWSLISVVGNASTTTSGQVRLATDAETKNGGSSTIAVTPAGLLANFAASLSTAGYLKIPTGIADTLAIIQWFPTNPITAGGSLAVNFPIAFPNACLHAQAAPLGGATSSASTSIAAGPPTTSGLTLYNWGGITADGLVIAIGY